MHGVRDAAIILRSLRFTQALKRYKPQVHDLIPRHVQRFKRKQTPSFFQAYDAEVQRFKIFHIGFDALDPVIFHPAQRRIMALRDCAGNSSRTKAQFHRGTHIVIGTCVVQYHVKIAGSSNFGIPGYGIPDARPPREE